jgi:succinate dehydrogenase/fumarate reductase cytochrome b subunit
MALFSPKIAYAASTSLNGFITNVDNTIINPLILFLFALAIVYFLYGVLMFILNQENEEKKTAGKSHMLWGIVGITIMLGVWTILNILINTLGLSGQINPEQGTVNLKK